MNLHFFHANFTTTIYGRNLHNNLILARSRDVIEHNFLMNTWYPYTICYGWSIVTESVSPAVCEILRPKHIGVTTHVTSLITWRFDSPYAVSYWCSIETEPLSASVSKLFDSKYIWSRPWPFKVTWRHRSRDDSIPHIGYPIGAPLEPSPYLQAFSRYLAL